MGFREKLLDFKKRLSDRKMYSIVVVIIAAVAIWGIYQYKHAASLRQELDNQYNRAFYDMSGYVNNVEVLLAKSLISNSPARTASTLQEAWRQANLAQTNLGQLPISPEVLGSTSKFLTQVGDLSYSLNNQNMQGTPLNDQQYKTIEKLQGYATKLNKSLNSLQSDLALGRLSWGELSKKGTPVFEKTSASAPKNEVENIQKTFQDYPTLIYDGPFSDHLAKAEAKSVTGDKLTAEQAKQSIRNLFGGGKITKIDYFGKNDSGLIKTYSYTVSFKDIPKEQTAHVDVTQKGGHILSMLYNRPSKSSTVTVDQAKALGKKFLDDHGFPDMVDTYYLKEDNSATINYAYKQDNVTAYPDLIKVKVALDNGEIIGLESRGYLSSHTKRTIPKPVVSEAQARKLINPKVNIISSGLAIIPTDYKTEIFTYEFKGKLNNKDFLVYINAETGREEKILMIIDTPKGILTM